MRAVGKGWDSSALMAWAKRPTGGDDKVSLRMSGGVGRNDETYFRYVRGVQRNAHQRSCNTIPHTISPTPSFTTKNPHHSLDADDQVDIPLFSHSQTGKRRPVRDVHPAEPFIDEKGDGVFPVLFLDRLREIVGALERQVFQSGDSEATQLVTDNDSGLTRLPPISSSNPNEIRMVRSGWNPSSMSLSRADMIPMSCRDMKRDTKRNRERRRD